MKRCDWAKGSYNEEYHDHEWGRPCHDDQKLFELLVLEGMQAGLSWVTILKKRAAFQTAFDHFDIATVAGYDEAKQAQLLQNSGIIRNRLKIQSAITNAEAVLRIQAEFGSLDAYLWGFVDGKPIVNSYSDQSEVPTHSPLSDRISKDMKKRGFRFAGTTIIYSYLEAIGIINDHMTWCDTYEPCKRETPSTEAIK